MIQQQITDPSQGEVKFFGGQTLADVKAGDPADKHISAEAPEATPEEKESSEKTEAVAPEKPAKQKAAPEQDTEAPEAEGDEYDAIVAKYNGDPKAMAKALRSLQQGFTRKSEALKRVLSSQQQASQFRESNGTDMGHRQQAAPKVEAPADDEIDESMLDEISRELADDPRKGIKHLLAESRQAGKSAFERAEAKRRAEAQAAAAKDVENHNINMIYDRAREILLERAEQAGDAEAIARYGNQKYVVTQEDYLDAYDDLEPEINYIETAISPRDGRLTAKHFQAARIMLNPESYNENLQRKARDTALKDDAPRPPATRQRVVLTPQASTHKATKKLDVKNFGGSRTEAQLQFSKMSDAELEAYERELVA